MRTDGDSWDLASSVGATATSVAASRALASRGPDPLIEDPYAATLVKAVGLPHFVKMAEGQLDVDDPLFSARQMCEHIAVRTRFFDQLFTDACAAGIRQAVILASGLDTRAYRLAWPAGTVVFEIDQPAVIDFKTQVLTDAGATPAAERRTVGVDLRDDWPRALRDGGFDPGQPTAWIAEGLLIYLPPEAQDRLLDAVTELSAPGSRLATEHMDAKALTGDWAKAMTERGRRLGSTIDLTELFYTGTRNSAADHLRAQGWSVTVQPNSDAYVANGFAPPADELIALTGDSGYLTAQLG
ncbi:MULTISPECIES: class I SAM-dependent methyltransferase [Mycobacteriaceae]|uniref:Class I SAM-dependent methyltransferase n=1 Tax=Mycolicibacterium parafortuitum TaxID=39692 RepID=A0ACC6MHJ2_MYCPF|nr:MULTISPECIES: class I SAM-dependent methyltransferase [Mycobacteriaceae]MDZ5086393.1 class I SAM-dependent methyltransferase [Mycolicibacterium parafortuitum]GFM17218.1 S-adenosyl-L-methionine-dependent methyl transferase [Mycobacterium sp. PO1]GFM23511.1 S-adenosyl-L-methionine-dependent methyl transferase [Mycobacterium sp. PO2]